MEAILVDIKILIDTRKIKPILIDTGILRYLDTLLAVFGFIYCIDEVLEF